MFLHPTNVNQLNLALILDTLPESKLCPTAISERPVTLAMNELFPAPVTPMTAITTSSLELPEPMRECGDTVWCFEPLGALAERREVGFDCFIRPLLPRT